MLRAAEKGGRVTVVLELLENGVTANGASGPLGWTPLYVAAASGRVAVVDTIIDGGADVNQ